MLEGRGKVIRNSIYIPVGVGRDSSFPFVDGEKVEVVIEGKCVIIRKIL